MDKYRDDQWPTSTCDIDHFAMDGKPQLAEPSNKHSREPGNIIHNDETIGGPAMSVPGGTGSHPNR